MSLVFLPSHLDLIVQMNPSTCVLLMREARSRGMVPASVYTVKHSTPNSLGTVPTSQRSSQRQLFTVA